jgi:uncharacterized membrane protein
MMLFYAGAGVNHFIHPVFYVKIMPGWLPLHNELVLISGICELAFALLLLFPSTRRLGACCIIALLIAVFPANIQMMVNYYRDNDPMLWITILRLPIQLILIWWAYGFTKPVISKN